MNAKKYKSVSSNIAKFQEQKNTLEYHEEFDYVKKLYLNKFSLINGRPPLNPTPSDKAIMFLWQEAIEKFIEHRFSESMTSIKKIIRADSTQYRNVCYLLVINKFYANDLSNIKNDFGKCKELNSENNNFSLFILESIINRKLSSTNEQMDRFLYENGQEFENLDNIISYLKIALVFDEHQKIKSLLPNLPPDAYENKVIRELLAFVFFRLGEKEQAKNFLQNINTVNSNNLLATLLIGEKKFNLALARLLVSYNINSFSEATLDRLIVMTIVSRNFDKGVEYIESKKYFLNSFNADIDDDEYKLLSVYLNIKKGNHAEAYSILKGFRPVLEENIPDVFLSMGSYLASVTDTRKGDEKDFLYLSCKRKNILSCYFLQTMTYFPELKYFIDEFNASTFKLSTPVDQLKSKVYFSPIKEKVFIDQKYIEELDSLEVSEI